MRMSMLASVAVAVAAVSIAAAAHAQQAPAAMSPPPAAAPAPGMTATPAAPAAQTPMATTTTTTTTAATPAPSADANAAPTSSTTAQYAAGTAVVDPQGGAVGTVEKTYTQADGSTVVAVNIDGKTLGLPANALRMTDGKLTASVGKAQILAAAAGAGAAQPQ